MSEIPLQGHHPSLRSEFPRWGLPFDPLIEQYKVTLGYRLFAERRQNHANVTYWWSAARVPGLAKFCVGSIILILAVAMSIKTQSCVLLFLPAIVLPLLRFSGQSMAVNSTAMPGWICEVFSDQGYHRNAATDLWLAGLTGKEVCGGIYIELVLRRMSFLRISFMILCVGATLAVFHDLRWSQTKFVLLVGIGYFLYRFYFYAFAWIMYRTGVAEMRERLDAWEGKPKAGTRVMRSIGYSLSAMILFGVLILPLLVCTQCSVRGVALGELFGAVGFALLGLFMQFNFARLRDSIYWRSLDAMKSADLAFDSFMASIVQEDELGRSWALWYHNKNRDQPRPSKVNKMPDVPWAKDRKSYFQIPIDDTSRGYRVDDDDEGKAEL